MTINYYYDNKRFYTHQTPANMGSLPPQNAVRDKPNFLYGYWPKWTKDGWINIENHTAREYDGVTKLATSYWLPGDNWDTPAHHMTEFGPLPDSALLAAPAKLLEVVKAEAKDRLKAYRQEIEYGGFMLNGQRWDSEQKDELRLNSASKIFEAGLPEYAGWKIADGVYITLTPTILQQATMAFMQHTGRAFALEAAKLAQIDALESSEAVLAWLESDMKNGWNQPEPEVDTDA